MSDPPLLYSYKRYVLVVARELVPLTSSIELPAECGAINGSYGSLAAPRNSSIPTADIGGEADVKTLEIPDSDFRFRPEAVIRVE